MIPAALCRAYGLLVGDRRQGWLLLVVMLMLLGGGLALGLWAEGAGNPRLAALGLDPAAGNWEGKEARFGMAGSVLWAVATTVASNGSVNAMHDSFTHLGGLVPLVMMQLGEVVFGGWARGSTAACFVLCGIHRRPWWTHAGDRAEIRAGEINWRPCVRVPLFAVWCHALAVTGGRGGGLNPGPTLQPNPYAFSSMGNNTAAPSPAWTPPVRSTAWAGPW